MMIIFVTILLYSVRAQDCSGGHCCTPEWLNNGGDCYFDGLSEHCVKGGDGDDPDYQSSPPAAFEAVCEDNIIEWRMVPHDVQIDCTEFTTEGKCDKIPEFCTWDEDSCENVPYTMRGDGTCRLNGSGDPVNNYRGQDWWYWKSDWSEKIAKGQGDRDLIAENRRCNTRYQLPNSQIEGVTSVEDCNRRCMFAFSTTTSTRERCQHFDYSEEDQICTLYSFGCWSLRDADGYSAYRLKDIYPVGFKAFSLREFNEPPTCIHVPNSSDKKVEVMIETASKDSRICIMDGNDMGVGTNNEVGNVKTCDNGQLYACFTAATRSTNDDFYFYIFCDGSCEASDVDLWVRIRVSDRAWSSGKTDTQSDIEMWCEMEKGVTTEGKDDDGELKQQMEFTWPSELLPDYPSQLPFRITHLDKSPASMATVSRLALALLGAAAALWSL